MRTKITGPGRMEVHTSLRQLLGALGGRHAEFLWLVTDYECYGSAPAFPYDASSPPRIVTAAGLSAFADACDPQFIWGVLSGFDPRTRIDRAALPAQRSLVDDPEIWGPAAGPRFPGARVEVVCYDSSTTIIWSDDEDIHRRIQAWFPEAKPMAHGIHRGP